MFGRGARAGLLSRLRKLSHLRSLCAVLVSGATSLTCESASLGRPVLQELDHANSTIPRSQSFVWARRHCEDEEVAGFLCRSGTWRRHSTPAPTSLAAHGRWLSKMPIAPWLTEIIRADAVEVARDRGGLVDDHAANAERTETIPCSRGVGRVPKSVVFTGRDRSGP
jgi:hypothetical protein